MADDKNPPPAEPKASAPEPVKKFRVLHGAVSGVGKNKKGENVEHDYYVGAIVTSEQLGNNEAHYLIMGAITPTEG